MSHPWTSDELMHTRFRRLAGFHIGRTDLSDTRMPPLAIVPDLNEVNDGASRGEARRESRVEQQFLLQRRNW